MYIYLVENDGQNKRQMSAALRVSEARDRHTPHSALRLFLHLSGLSSRCPYKMQMFTAVRARKTSHQMAFNWRPPRGTYVMTQAVQLNKTQNIGCCDMNDLTDTLCEEVKQKRKAEREFN